MPLHRRALLASAPLFATWPTLVRAAPTAIEAYEAACGGHIGFHAENLDTGRSLGWRANQRFVMCSTFKASLAGLVLARVDRGEDSLENAVAIRADHLIANSPVSEQHLKSGTMTVEELCRAAVEVSDNGCANLLLARVGGPVALTRFWRGLGDATSRLDHNEPMLNRTPPGGVMDTTTPLAMAGVLRRLLMGDALSSASRAHLTRWMVDCRTGADRLRAGLPSTWQIADKTGNNGKDGFGDIAGVWTPGGARLLICAYTRGGAPTAAQVRSVFAGIGEMVARQLA